MGRDSVDKDGSTVVFFGDAEDVNALFSLLLDDTAVLSAEVSTPSRCASSAVKPGKNHRDTRRPGGGMRGGAATPPLTDDDDAEKKLGEEPGLPAGVLETRSG
ncbi:hypothetical protein TcCL_ESM04816 [Trypanosoma cruzi]|nr:hypothetical protein TcCL_ESM04816 [Trypanosoma cruzi]